MTEFIFVRHAVTAENLNYRLIGLSNPPLHVLGRQQTMHLATTLRKERIDRIVSSPLQRALQTATAIVEAHPHCTLEVEDELTEVNLGVVDGMSSFDVYEQHPVFIDEALRETVADFAFPGGESRAKARMRFTQVLATIATTTPDACVCVVTHGGVLGLWRCAIGGEPLGRFRRHQPSHASISRITIGTDDSPRILEWNNQSHLPPSLAEAIANARGCFL